MFTFGFLNPDWTSNILNFFHDVNCVKLKQYASVHSIYIAFDTKFKSYTH